MKWLLSLLVLTSCTISTPKEGQKIGRIVKVAEESILLKTIGDNLCRKKVKTITE